MTQLNSIRLETSRLYLVPLNYNQLLLYAQFNGSLEMAIGMIPVEREVTEELKITLEKFMIPYVIKNPELTLYATIWILILKDQNTIVGDIGFKGAPSDKGLLEIGYGTYPAFFNKGLMTEAVGGMTKWAFEQPEVKIILAETDKYNLASQRVLNKNGFEPFAETDTIYWWRLDKQD